MAAPNYQAADFVAAMQALLPRGAAWPRDPSATLTAVIAGLAGVYQQSTSDANQLLIQSFPATVNEMLLEWQETLGLLPSSSGETDATVDSPVNQALAAAAGYALTLPQKQALVVAALTDTGGQSIPYFIALAAAIGITITITEFTRYTVGLSVITPISDDAWASVWQVNAPIASAISYTSTADVVQATPGFGSPTLEVLLGAYKPAHTVVITSYS